MIEELIVSISLIGFYALVGSLIIIKAYKVKKMNVIYFGLTLLFDAISYINEIILIGILLDISTTLSLLLGLVFTKLTFYQKRKSPFPYFLIIVIVLVTIQIISGALGATIVGPDIYEFIRNASIGTYLIIVIGWIAYASFEARKEIKPLDIEPFQKKRYTLLGYSSACLALGGILMFLWTPTEFLPSLNMIIQLSIGVIAVIFVIMNYFVWVHPEFFRRYLNKGYVMSKADEQELSEDEIMRSLKGDD